MKFLSMLSLTLSGYCVGFNLPYNIQIQLDNGDFVSVETITDGDVVMVHDHHGHEQSAEAVNVSKNADMVQFTVLDYNHFNTHSGWIYENVENNQDYAIVSSYKTKDAKKIKKVKRSGNTYRCHRLLKPLGVAIAMSELPVVGGGPVMASLCPGICPVFLSIGCHPMVASLLVGAISTATAGAGAVYAGSVVAIMCNPATLGAMTSSCIPTCTVALAIPFIP